MTTAELSANDNSEIITGNTTEDIGAANILDAMSRSGRVAYEDDRDDGDSLFLVALTENFRICNSHAIPESVLTQSSLTLKKIVILLF